MVPRRGLHRLTPEYLIYCHFLAWEARLLHSVVTAPFVFPTGPTYAPAIFAIPLGDRRKLQTDDGEARRLLCWLRPSRWMSFVHFDLSQGMSLPRQPLVWLDASRIFGLHSGATCMRLVAEHTVQTANLAGSLVPKGPR